MRHILRQIASAIGVLTSLCRGSRSANILPLQPSCLPVLSPFVIAAFAAAAALSLSPVSFHDCRLRCRCWLASESCLAALPVLSANSKTDEKSLIAIWGLCRGIFFWERWYNIFQNTWKFGFPGTTPPLTHPTTHTHTHTIAQNYTQLHNYKHFIYCDSIDRTERQKEVSLLQQVLMGG